jgi:tight adherence protein B
VNPVGVLLLVLALLVVGALVVAVMAALRRPTISLQRLGERAQAFVQHETRVAPPIWRKRREDPPFWIPQPVFHFLADRMDQAGLTMPVGQAVTIGGAAAVAVALLFPILAGVSGKFHSLGALMLLALFALALSIGVPLIYLMRRADVRQRRFQEQFPTALDIFVRGLRAGHPMNAAMELLVEEMPDPLRSEFALVLAEIHYGSDLRTALLGMSRRVHCADLDMFTVATSVQAETGGNLADILDGLSRVIRERSAMELKVRALSSEGRMSGIVLGVLPIGVFSFIFATHPNFYLDASGDPWFAPGFILIIAAYFMGVMIMRRMINVQV